MDGLAALPGDQFYFLAHDDRGGAPQMSSDGLALGLAGCLIGELLLSGFVVLAENTVVACRRSSPPDELLLHEVYVTLGRQMPVRHALRTVAATAVDAVAQRMGRQGLLTYVQQPKWLGLGTRGRWVPVSSFSAASTQSLLVYTGRKYPNVDWTWGDVLVTAIADATALAERTYAHFPEARDGLARLMTQPAQPGPQITQLSRATSAALAAIATIR